MTRIRPPLTEKQAAIVEFIRQSLVARRMPPTREDISAHFGFKTRAAAQKHLGLIAQKGYIELIAGSARGIRFPEETSGIGRPSSAAWEDGPTDGRRPAPQLPLIGRVAAGTPITAEQNIDTWCAVSPEMFRPRADFLHQVSGHSMREANILDGDLVGIHAQAEADNGEIIVARLFDARTGDDSITLKRYFRRGDTVVLRSENSDPQYVPIEIDLSGHDVESQEFPAFQIAGIYAGLLRCGRGR